MIEDKHKGNKPEFAEWTGTAYIFSAAADAAFDGDGYPDVGLNAYTLRNYPDLSLQGEFTLSVETTSFTFTAT
jgi:hypothetical protein